MMKKLTLLIFFLFSAFTVAFAQSTIKGKVTDKTGQGLPGVTVVVKGTTNGTQTDVNGNYSLRASANATLTFSFIGFASQDVAVGSQTVINVTLTESANNLNEVVVIGYGAQRKATVTGAISSVSANDLKDQEITRIDEALQGRAAGVFVAQSSGAPGSAPSVIIRGYNSLSNSNPLYVIDGQIWDNGGYDAVNPNDIESIQVLKDASAAIYGSRASNGVILITTKKGSNATPRITYNSYYGVQSVAKKLDLTNATQYATLRNEAATNDGQAAPFSASAISQLGAGTNWQNQIFGNAPIDQQNLSVSGGTDKSNYYTSLGYLDQKGIVMPDYSDYKRLSLRVNSSFQPKKYLRFGENINYSYTRSTTNFNTNSVFGGPLSDAINLDPLTPTVVSNVNAQPNASVYQQYSSYLVRNAQGLPYGISNQVANEITNPLAAMQLLNGNYNWSHNLMGDVFLELTPIKGLSIKTEVAGKQGFWGSESYTPLYYLNANTSNLVNNNQYRQMNQNLEWNWDNTATYTNSIGKNNFTVLVGTSAEQESGWLVQDTNYGEPISSYQNASFNFNLPQTDRYGYASDNQPLKHASYFGRITYDYDQKYLAQVILRRDGSSRFGPNNIYGNFPSASLGWVISKEDFFPKNSFVDYLKLRGSYGILGNEQALTPFYYAATISGIGSYVFGGAGSQTLYTGYGPTTLANPNLEWERDKAADIALDATIFHDITLTVDFYNKASDQLLLQTPLPAYAGVTNQPWANAGGVTNKGVEFQAGYNKKVGDFTLNFNGNISYNKNIVTNLSVVPYLNAGSWQGASPGNIQRTQVGEPIYAFYDYKVTGIFQSQAQINAYTNADGSLIQPNAKPGDFIYAHPSKTGTINPNDREFLGSPFPTWTYGFNFSAKYKEFDFAVFGQGVWGNKIFQEYRRLDISTANYPAAALDAWTPTNTNTNYPRLTTSDPNHNFNQPSSFELESGAYMRIKSLQLGYTLPKSVISKLDVNRIRIYVSGDNLFTITKYDGFDPEISSGVDQGLYPAARTFRVGIDATL